MEKSDNNKMSNNWINENVSSDVSEIVCRISMQINGVDVISGDFLTQLNVDYDNLEDELENTPSVYAYWTFILAEAEAQLAILERNIKNRRGMLYTALFSEYDKKTAGIKESGYTPDKMPQWQAKEIVEADEDLNRDELKLILAQRNYTKIRAIVDSIKMKAEHLRSLAGFKKQEKFNSK